MAGFSRSFAIFFFFGSVAANAQMVSQDMRYVYVTTPWTHRKDANNGQIQTSVKAAMERVSYAIADGVAQKLYPETFRSADDFRKVNDLFSAFQGVIDDMEKNFAPHKLVDQSPTLWSVAPDAFLVTFGGTFGLNSKIGGGGAVTFNMAMVMMPVYIVRFDKLTGEKKEGWKLKTSFIFLGMPQITMGVDKPLVADIKVGLGMAWGGIQFTEPEKLKGAGFGLVGEFAVPVGIRRFGVNTSVYALFNDMHGAPDITLAFFGTDLMPVVPSGPAPKLKGGIGFTAILTLEEFLDIVYRASDTQKQRGLREMQDQLTRIAQDGFTSGSALDGRNGNGNASPSPAPGPGTGPVIRDPIRIRMFEDPVPGVDQMKKDSGVTKRPKP